MTETKFVIEKRRDKQHEWDIWYTPKGEGGHLILTANEQEMKQLSKSLKEKGF